jgi:hypothetical protein
MLLNSASLDTAVLNGKASDTQSLAASAVVVCSTSAQTVKVTKNLSLTVVSLSSAAANVTLAKPIGGSAQVSANATPAVTHVAYVFAGSSSFVVSAQAELPMTKLLAGFRATGTLNSGALNDSMLGSGQSFVSAKSESVASLLVIRSLAANAKIVSSAAGGIIDVIPLGALHGTSAVSNIIKAEMGLTVNLGASVASGVSTYGKAGILYVVESSVSFDIAVEAALLKIDNLRNLDGVGAITNIISAAMHVRKPLGGSVALSVVERHKFVVANTIDATHYRGTFVDVDVGTALLSIRDNGIYAGDVQVVLGQDLAMAA